MQCDSDTESESDSELERKDSAPRASTPLRNPSSSALLASPDGPPLLVVEHVQQEIQKLCHLDVTDDACLLSLQPSADILLLFLASFPGLALNCDSEEILLVFSSLVNFTFLDRLFQYRALVRQLAIRSSGIPSAFSILTWVDEFLAKLSLLLPDFASGFIPLPHERGGIGESIRLQKRDDTIRAVIQLPEKFHDLHSVIGTSNFSPAAKRIATTLLFATYVIDPQLTQVEFPPEKSELLASLHFAARHLSSTVQLSLNAYDDLPRRVNAAMLLVLFSVLGSQTDLKEDSVVKSPKLLPERFGCLLDLITLVMNQESNDFFPLEELDAPQVVLLRWGNVVPWSWTTWNDQRIANTEHLRLLTATWLCHLNDVLLPGMRSMASKIFRVDLHSCLMKDISASSLMIMQLFRDTVGYMKDSPVSENPHRWRLDGLLVKLSWALIQYLESHVIQTNSTIEAQIVDVTKCTLVVYCNLGFSQNDMSVKSAIIEALTLINADHFTNALRNVLLDNTSQFLLKFGQVTRECAKRLDSEENKAEDLHVDSGKALLDFFAVILMQDKSKNTTIQEIGRSFVTSLAKLMLGPQSSSCQTVQSLRNSFLISTFALEAVTGKGIERYRKEDIWVLAIHSGRCDMITAGTFAQYLLVASTKRLDPLSCHEAWDYLLSAATTLLDRETAPEEQPIALLAITAICSALRKLLSCSDVLTRSRFMSSPWTFSMEKMMHTFTAYKENVTLPYEAILKKRLGNIGEILLKQMNEITSGLTDISNITSSKMDYLGPNLAHRLVYYRDDNYTGLVLVCDIDSKFEDSGPGECS